MNRINKAIFLDRDGVINLKRDDYVKSISEFVFLPNVHSFIKKLCDMGFLIIVVTNQSVVNRGLISNNKLNEIHEYMLRELNKQACKINKIYFCPHRPDENCNCRKPRTGLIMKAIEEFKVDISRSWLIGDSNSDIEAANSVGLKSIKVDKEFDLRKAVEIISNEL